MSKEAMKLALEALEDKQPDDPYPHSLESKAITALREALEEQPAQQEPVTFITPLMEQQMFDDWCPYKGNPDPRVVWAAAVNAVNGFLLGATPQAQPTQQEPVAWCTKNNLKNMAKGFTQDVPARAMRVCQPYPKESIVLLYTSPPAQQQEPIAYAVYHRMGGSKSLHWTEQHSPDGDASQYQLLPLYTSSPPQRKPLTDEEISAEVEKELTHYWNGEYIDTTGARDQLTAFARAIEAAHQIGVEK